MSAERLREAAALMRERAEAATHGDGEVLPWVTEAQEGTLWEVYAEHYGTQITVNVQRAEAQHIASWHPAVALAVADWLDGCAARVDMTSQDRLDRDAEERDWYLPALAVANAYLGDDP